MSKQDGRGRQVTVGPVDDSETPILHLDLDAFFASVELLERPELRDQPVVIGHRGGRSVVSAANYVARRYGVNSAMPMAVALRRCPHAVVLEPHYDRYSSYSARVMDLCRSVSPLVEQLSIDEAFLDVSGARRLLGSPVEIATALRARVEQETGLTCSIGVAASKFVAKLASGRAKPDGLLVVPRADTLAFLHPLPVSALWGVGARSEERLRQRGIGTVADLAHTPLPTLQSWIGDAGARRLHELAWGRDPRTVTPEHEEKSVGHETTFEVDVRDPDTAHRHLLRLAGRVGARLRAGGLAARTVSIKVRFGDFTTLTRSRTLTEATDVGRRLYEEARSLYDELGADARGIRLLGVRAEQLEPGGGTNALWDDDGDWRDTESAVDALERRFGAGAVGPASLLRGRPPKA